MRFRVRRSWPGIPADDFEEAWHSATQFADQHGLSVSEIPYQMAGLMLELAGGERELAHEDVVGMLVDDDADVRAFGLKLLLAYPPPGGGSVES